MTMQRSAALDGIRARGSSWVMSRLAEQVLELSHAGLKRHAKDEAQFLEPLQRVVTQKLTRADHLIEAYQKAKRKADELGWKMPTFVEKMTLDWLQRELPAVDREFIQQKLDGYVRDDLVIRS